MQIMKRMQLVLLTVMTLISLGGTNQVQAQTKNEADPALAKALQDVYLYWRNATVTKNYNRWRQITASHRKIAIQNRILSEKGRFPADVFKVPTAPPGLDGLKLLRARTRGVTTKLVFFGKVDFGIGGDPSDNLFVLSFVHEGRGWKYDMAEFINLSALKDVRSQLKSGNLDYVDGEAFLPDGKRPPQPITVQPAKYIAKVYTYCPGREVKVTVNKVSKHRFQDTQQAEVVIGGVFDGRNEIRYSIKNLPDYKGDEPMTLRVYIFSQLDGVKPVKVFEYQTVKGEKPKQADVEAFSIDPATGAKVLRK